MDRLKLFVETCLKTRIFRYKGKINIITEKETVRILEIIEEMLKDGRK